MNTDRTDLGDRMKELESRETSSFMTNLPICVRIDGRNFSQWTKGLARPYDTRLTEAMIETTRHLVAESSAIIGYTQSDEISLVLYAGDYTEQIYCGGKRQKMVSLLASEATAYFGIVARDLIPEKNVSAADGSPWKKLVNRLPRFDCRAFAVPNLGEAANYLLWRELDATRNSVSMLAQSHYSSKELHGQGRANQLDMLHAKGVNWNNFPSSFKRGTYLRRIPKGDRNPVELYLLDPLRKYTHNERVDVLFGKI